MKEKLCALLLVGVVGAFAQGPAKPASAETGASKFALHDALRTREYDKAMRLIPLARDLDAMDADGHTPLTLAASDKTADAFDMVQALLKMGADPNLPDGTGYTPVHHAAKAGTLAVVQLLVDTYGAEVESGEQVEPVLLAVRNGHERITQFLLSRGARLSREDRANAAVSVATRKRMEELQQDPAFFPSDLDAEYGADLAQELRAIMLVQQATRDSGAPQYMVDMLDKVLERTKQWNPSEHGGLTLQEWSQQIRREELAKATKNHREEK